MGGVHGLGLPPECRSGSIPDRVPDRPFGSGEVGSLLRGVPAGVRFVAGLATEPATCPSDETAGRGPRRRDTTADSSATRTIRSRSITGIDPDRTPAGRRKTVTPAHLHPVSGPSPRPVRTTPCASQSRRHRRLTSSRRRQASRRRRSAAGRSAITTMVLAESSIEPVRSTDAAGVGEGRVPHGTAHRVRQATQDPSSHGGVSVDHRDSYCDDSKGTD